MGAWGHRNFDNDTAADYVATFQENPVESTIFESLEAAFEDEYVDADVASEALAAAEIVAAAQQKATSDFPQDLLSSIASLHFINPESAKKLARRAVKAILKESELQELWEEGDDYKSWRAVQRELLERLA